MSTASSPSNHYLLAIDPGRSTGIALGMFSEDEPYSVVETWQPRDGASGFLAWWHSHALYNAMGPWTDDDVMISERFILRSAPKDGRVPDIEPVRIEGVMLALGLDVHYQDRWAKSLVDDSVLKQHGLYISNAQARERFGHPDGRDANDAVVHSLAYLKSIRHLPTLREFWS